MPRGNLAGSLLTHTPGPTVTKEDIQNHFKDGPGSITEIKLMNGFGFIEYDDAVDARDVVPGTFFFRLIDLYTMKRLLTCLV